MTTQMTQWHQKSNRKETGGILRTGQGRSKRLYQKGGLFAETTLAPEAEIKVMKGRGNTSKAKMRKATMAAVTNPATKKTQNMKLVWVNENKANRLYVRRNIITKGTTVEIEDNGEKKYARVTNRPGQDGSIQAMLLDKKPEGPVKPVKATKAKAPAKEAKKESKK